MAQLTVLNPDGSIADIFSIPDNFACELTKIVQNSNRKSLDLALLREIKVKALSIVSRILKERNIKTDNPEDIEAFAISNLDCFDSLLDVILRIEKLPNSDFLTICLSA